MTKTDITNWLRLHLTRGLGRKSLITLINHYGSAEAALAATRHQWASDAGVKGKALTDPPGAGDTAVTAAVATIAQLNIDLVTLWDDRYPYQLRHISDPPALLYTRGSWPHVKALAIVGSRHCSISGQRWAEALATQLSNHQFTIVSGMARGIDSAAHRGALQGAGSTIAVLGCGVDQIYPKENRSLYQHIIERGLVISEYPPGTPPLPGHFPGRNRIISGLSEGVLIVEAATKSGSLITADFALEQGRDVFAVPGAPHDKHASGCLELIKQGATLVSEASDILDYYGMHVQTGPPQADSLPLPPLSDGQQTVLTKLTKTPLHLDKLASESGLTPMEVSAIVLHLELLGLAESLPGGHYIRGFPS
jgi:DNA processing protein